LRLVEHNADISFLGVDARIAVVFDVAGFEGEDGVVAAYADVFAWMPEGAALAEDYVARDYVFVYIVAASVSANMWRGAL